MIRIKSIPLAIAGVGLLFAGIFGASILGFWKTVSTKDPAKIKTGEFAGLPSPSDIRGSYTWTDIEKAFKIPAADLMEAFGSSSADLKVNSLEAAYAGKLPEGLEIGTDSVRLFVALYTGLPHQAAAGTVLPGAAIAVLERSGKADTAALASYKAIAAKLSGAAEGGQVSSASPVAGSAKTTAKPVTASPAPLAKVESAAKPEASAKTEAAAKGEGSADHAIQPGTLGGTTTFGELKAWGAAEVDIKDVLGGKIGTDSDVIKDFCSANGLKFGEVKGKLQALLPQS